MIRKRIVKRRRRGLHANLIPQAQSPSLSATRPRRDLPEGDELYHAVLRAIARACG